MKTTLTVINGKVGIADERYPYPEKPVFSPIKGMTSDDEWECRNEEYNEAIELCLSHMTFFADEEQQIVMRIISFHLWQEVAGHTIPDGPYTVEGFPPYEKVGQFRHLTEEWWIDLKAPDAKRFEDVEYRTILRFTKQETKPKTPYDTFMEKVNKENGIEQETKPQPM